MTEYPQQTQEEEPILIQLRNAISSAEALLAKGLVPKGSAGMCARRLRARIAKLYGKQSPLLGIFLTVPLDPSSEDARSFLEKYASSARRFSEQLERLSSSTISGRGKQIFIGHGRSADWREFKDFLADRLGLPWEEFNRTPVAGNTTSDRLKEMLDTSVFAFLIMTAEDEHADTTFHARPNVIHEVGLFQGRLGIHRAIILLEEGCAEFSNIIGLSQIRYPRGRIGACFEDVRRVLEREGVI